ncbi:hypothetical protein ACU4GD_35595 [Cupriavidus basilensis]
MRGFATGGDGATAIGTARAFQVNQEVWRVRRVLGMGLNGVLTAVMVPDAGGVDAALIPADRTLSVASRA